MPRFFKGEEVKLYKLYHLLVHHDGVEPSSKVYKTLALTLVLMVHIWWTLWDSNPGSAVYETDALTY